MPAAPALPGWALEQAVDWLLRLDPPRQADAQLHSRLQGSMGAAMQQLQRSSKGLHHASRQALLAPAPTQARRRRLLGSGLAVVLAGLGTSWLTSRHTPFPALAADLHTGTGERLQHQLADGSTLLLDAGSAVDIAFGRTQRLVQFNVRNATDKHDYQTIPSRANWGNLMTGTPRSFAVTMRYQY